MKKFMTTFASIAVGLLFAGTSMAAAPPIGQHLQSFDKPFETMNFDGAGAPTGICLKEMGYTMTPLSSVDAAVFMAEIGIHRPEDLKAIHDDSAILDSNSTFANAVELGNENFSPPTDRPLEVTVESTIVAVIGANGEQNKGLATIVISSANLSPYDSMGTNSVVPSVLEEAVDSNNSVQHIPFTG